jgi:hypothetical protein
MLYNLNLKIFCSNYFYKLELIYVKASFHKYVMSPTVSGNPMKFLIMISQSIFSKLKYFHRKIVTFVYHLLPYLIVNICP